jgi:uncharacterized ion transporter superfamily protein YfcC
MKLRLPNTYVLIFAILALIALSTWLVPGGKYDTHLVNGKQLVDPTTFHYVASKPQGIVALLMAPIKGFVEAALIIGFVLITGGAFAVLQKTDAIDAMIKSIARAHDHSRFVRVALIPVFLTLFSLGGATFGMNEEAIPFILIFVPLALALGYDTVTGVSLPFLGTQIGGVLKSIQCRRGAGHCRRSPVFRHGLPPDRVGGDDDRDHRLHDVVRGAHQAPPATVAHL